MPRKPAFSLLAPILLCLIGPAWGRAADDIEQFARDVIVEAGQTTGDVVCFFCAVSVRGVVEGDVVVIGGGIEVHGGVVGDAVASGGGIRLGPRAKVGGEVVAIAGPFEQDAGASVKGDVESNPWAYIPGQRQIFLRSVVTLVGLNVGLLALAALILRRRRVEIMAKVVRRRYVLIAVLGVAVLALFVILLVLCNYTGQAQPVLALIALGVFGVAALAGGAGLSCCLGGTLPQVEGWGQRVFAGAVLLAILQLIPVAGMFVFVVLAIIAPGIATLSGLGSAEDWLPRLLARRRGPVPAAENQASEG
ncbi:MAG: hypothetical protein HYS61_06245 [Acidobacteria bacterium]|nr:hypothetical protein [Acidobacteriota bacterium]